MADDVEPYGLDPAFEDALITALCSQPTLFSRIGFEIEIKALRTRPAQLAMKAAKSIASESGNGPSSLRVVTQRLRRWMTDGMNTQEEINEVMELFDEAEDEGIPTENEIVAEMAPILKQRARGKNVEKAIDAFGKQGDMTAVAKAITTTERIGEAQQSLGVDMDGAFDEIATLQGIERWPTGIDEVDVELEGGYAMGELWMWMGGAGEGKSLALVQSSVAGLLESYNVAYASMEISRARTFARIVANITGMPTNAIMNGKMDAAKDFMASMVGNLGFLKVEYFSPGGTKVEDIKNWVDRIEQKKGIKMHGVVVDYADKLTPDDNKSGMYTGMGQVYEDYRVWMEKEDRFGITASATTRKKGKDSGQLTGVNDGADSQHKVRIVDGAISINRDKENGTNKYVIVKNRNGVADQVIGPIPTQFDIARISPVTRDYEMLQGDVPPPQGTLLH